VSYGYLLDIEVVPEVEVKLKLFLCPALIHFIKTNCPKRLKCFLQLMIKNIENSPE